MNSEEIWKHVRLFNEWLDRDSASSEDPRILRTLKLAEEVGGVASAIIGATGQNPRKGVTNAWDDVQDEVCDVILTAMVALDSMAGDAEEKFAAHVQKRYARILGLNEPTCACCGEKAYVQGDGKWWCGNCVSRCESQEESE